MSQPSRVLIFTEAGTIALTAFISPFREERKRVRDLMPEGRFIEVYCDCSLEVCEQRDVKGLYAKARAGIIPEFTGISDPYEVPEDAEIVLDTSNIGVEEAAQVVYDYLVEHGYVSA